MFMQWPLHASVPARHFLGILSRISSRKVSTGSPNVVRHDQRVCVKQ